MSVSTIKIDSVYKPAEGDYLLLPFFDGNRPAFSPGLLPGDFPKVSAPEDAGGGKTVFVGQTGGKQMSAFAARLDKKYSTPPQEMKTAVASALEKAEQEKAKRVVVFLGLGHTEYALAAHEGAWLGSYRFDRYLSEKAKPLPVLIVVQDATSVRKKTAPNEVAFGYVNFARDLLNEPACEIHPESLAKIFAKTGREAGLKITVWDDKRLQKENCGGLLTVGKGAKSKPCLVIGEYHPRGATRHLALVGKGVTFDTGGYCLKPSDSQPLMERDMGGAAMMFAAACAIAKLKLPVKITVITPLAENDISANACHPNDILRTRSGLTVQVANTDAEGRLILADALALAAEKKPDWIVDAATLTGACVVALGEDIAGTFGTEPKLTRNILDAGRQAGEFFWELPLHLPYLEKLKSTIADTSNMGGKFGGSIIAALFLKKFVPEEQAWAHIDIAGPGIKQDALGHLGKGAKGFGVKTMIKLAEELAG
jgi:leucyl aminopeptidase